MAARKKRTLTPEEQLEAALVPEEEWPYELPDNWCWVRLGTCISKSTEKSNTNDPTVLYVGLENFESGAGIAGYADASGTKSVKSVFRPGQILYGRLRPYLNKHDVAKVEGVCSTDILVYEPTECAEAQYVNLFLDTKEFIEHAVSHSKGINLPRVSPTEIEAAFFPLPPLHEQRRITSRIEWLFAKLDDAEAELREVISDSEGRQSSVLHSAFCGDLTTQWRRKHEGHDASPIADIAAFAKDWKTKDQRLLVEQQAKCVDRDLDGHIWTECTVGAIGRVTNGSTPSRKVPAYWGGDIPWVSSGEVRNNIITETHECITDEGYNRTSVNLLPAGTVLIAMIGEGKTRGQSAILHIPATINQNVAAVVIDHGFVEPRFLWYWFKYSYRRNREAGSGTGPQALNCQRVRELPFILPGKDEQAEIVRRLDILLEREQQTQSLALDALEAIGKMRQAVLSKALHGELGTNDPAQPSSKELLASIVSGNAGK
ncbi:MAG: hypothetical protein E7Z99_01155 [Coriobacteriaceae bacterium]|nr:hypothetical protein [Coriobacteriaceae bacterium]